jgi:hypothetical protein
MKKLLVSITFIIVSFFLSCSQIESIRDKHSLKSRVIEYNRLFIEVNKSRDLEPLKDIADKDVVRKLFLWMAAWEDGNVYMDAELKNLDFLTIRISDNKGRVTTTEDWEYLYRDLDTQVVVSKKESIHYEMEYILEKKHGKWMITEINILKESKPR